MLSSLDFVAGKEMEVEKARLPFQCAPKFPRTQGISFSGKRSQPDHGCGAIREEWCFAKVAQMIFLMRKLKK
jgi:hypothetical protein